MSSSNNSNSPQRFVGIDEIVSAAYTIIPDADRRRRNIFRFWVYLGERDIGTVSPHVKTCKVEVDKKSKSIKKPKDMLRIEDIGLYTKSGELKWKYEWRGGKVHKNEKLWPERIELSEDNDYYYLTSYNSTYHNNDIEPETLVEYALLRYYSLPLDDDGNVLIPESHMQALMYYIKYMDAISRSLPTVEVDRQRWLMERAKAYSFDKMPDQIRARQIAKEWMSLISAKIDNYRF